MSNIPTRGYVERRTAEIAAACERRDGARAAGLIRLTVADGYRDLAESLTNELVDAGLEHVAAGGSW